MKALKTLRRNWIIIWLLIACLMLGSLVSYGAYTGVTTAKRVVSLSSHDGILFTSKYMSRNNIGVQPAIFIYDNEKTDEQNTPIVVVDVCNYDMGLNVYDKAFHFKLKARLVNRDGSDITQEEWAALSPQPSAYTIAYKSFSDSTGALSGVTYSSTPITLTYEDQYLENGVQYLFPGADKTKYLFEIRFDVEDIKVAQPTYAVRIEAEKVENYSDIENLFGFIKAVQGGERTETTWEGKYMDVTTGGRKPGDYDGINYQISGNAEGTVSLRYPSDIVEINLDDYKQFTIARPHITSTIGGVNYKTMYIYVNPENRSMYDIRFYWVAGRNNSLLFDENFIRTGFEE